MQVVDEVNKISVSQSYRSLSKNERKVCLFWLAGESISETARLLEKSEKGIKTARVNILRKFLLTGSEDLGIARKIKVFNLLSIDPQFPKDELDEHIKTRICIKKSITLTAHRKRILQALCEPKKNIELCKEFGIEEKTLKNHISHIATVMGVTGRYDIFLAHYLQNVSQTDSVTFDQLQINAVGGFDSTNIRYMRYVRDLIGKLDSLSQIDVKNGTINYVSSSFVLKRNIELIADRLSTLRLEGESISPIQLDSAYGYIKARIGLICNRFSSYLNNIPVELKVAILEWFNNVENELQERIKNSSQNAEHSKVELQ